MKQIFVVSFHLSYMIKLFYYSSSSSYYYKSKIFSLTVSDYSTTIFLCTLRITIFLVWTYAYKKRNRVGDSVFNKCYGIKSFSRIPDNSNAVKAKISVIKLEATRHILCILKHVCIFMEIFQRNAVLASWTG